MKREEKASLSIMKIMCVTIILILISGIAVMAVNTNLKDTKIVLKNGYELSVLTSKRTVSEVLKEGINLSAKVSSELIQNIFMPRTPLHDGAIVIDKSEILAAKCILPLASEVSVPKNLGTRHRAAVGITEISDALVIVVSEETGIISLVENGKLRRELTGDTLKELLLTKLDRTKTAVNIKNIVKK